MRQNSPTSILFLSCNIRSDFVSLFSLNSLRELICISTNFWITSSFDKRDSNSVGMAVILTLISRLNDQLASTQVIYPVSP